ncbi:MAG: hypothetical protein ABH952_05645 [Candidatus Omnitrophota bacterium]
MKQYKSDGTPINIEARIYDKNYRLKEVKDGLNNTTKYTYDNIGNLYIIEDANSNKTRYWYDPYCNYRIAEIDPLGKIARYTYYKNGRLNTKQDKNKQTITYEYNLAGRLKKAIYPDASSVQYQYNKYGKTSRMTDSQGITNYTYNNRGWLTEVDGPEANDTVSNTYDNVGSRLSMTTSGEGTYNYTYYNNDLLQTITNPQTQVTTFTYDTAERCKSMVYANGTKTEWNYYDNDQVQNLSVKDATAQTLNSFAYEYNTLNQLIKIIDKDNNTYNYTYDNAGQLVHEDKKDAGNIIVYYRDYTYDPAGNRISEIQDGQNIAYSYNAGNQLILRSLLMNTITYTYNANGNLTTETSFVSGVKNYTYDYENRLTNATLPGGTFETYAYSGDGRRIAVNTNGNVVKYIYDAGLPIIERDAAGTTLTAYTRIPEAPGGIGGLISAHDSILNTQYTILLPLCTLRQCNSTH